LEVTTVLKQKEYHKARTFNNVETVRMEEYFVCGRLVSTVKPLSGTRHKSSRQKNAQDEARTIMKDKESEYHKMRSDWLRCKCSDTLLAVDHFPDQPKSHKRVCF